MARYKIEEQIVETLGGNTLGLYEIGANSRAIGVKTTLKAELLPEPAKIIIDVGLLNTLGRNECPWECDVTKSCKQCIASHIRLLADNEA